MICVTYDAAADFDQHYAILRLILRVTDDEHQEQPRVAYRVSIVSRQL